MASANAIPAEEAARLCAAVREDNRGRWYTFNGLWCWGCWTFTKGKPGAQCYAGSADNRGCSQVNRRYDGRG